jgi:hypothetical protein
MDAAKEIAAVIPGSKIRVIDKSIPQSFAEWLKTAAPGDSWEITPEQLPDAEKIRAAAETSLKKRNKMFRLWGSIDNTFTVKVWLYGEPAPLPFWRKKQIKENEKKRAEKGRYANIYNDNKENLETSH